MSLFVSVLLHYATHTQHSSFFQYKPPQVAGSSFCTLEFLSFIVQTRRCCHPEEDENDVQKEPYDLVG